MTFSASSGGTELPSWPGIEVWTANKFELVGIGEEPLDLTAP